MKTKNGFSIVEMLIYVAILASVAVVVVNVALILAESYGSLQASRSINTSATVALERMIREIRASTAVDTGNSVLGSHPGALMLSQATTTVEFFLFDGVLSVREVGDDVSESALTSGRVEVTNLVFRFITSGVIESVKIEMTLERSIGPITKTENFHGFAVLRGTY